MDEHEKKELNDAKNNPAFGVLGMQMGVNFTDSDGIIAEKITSEHISQMIEATRESDNATAKRMTYKIWLNFAYVICAISAFIIIILLLRGNQELLTHVITISASFLGGLGTGFAISNKKRD